MKNKFGFTLVETVIGMAVLSIVMLVILSLTTWSTKSNSQLDRINEIEDLHARLQTFIRDRTKCTSALSGKIYDPATNQLSLTQLIGNSGIAEFSVGQQFGGSEGIRISEINLTGFDQIESRGSLSRGIARMSVSYFDPKANTPSQTLKKVIPIVVTRKSSTLNGLPSAQQHILISCHDSTYQEWFLGLNGPANIYSDTAIGVGTNLIKGIVDIGTFPGVIGNLDAGGSRLIWDFQSVGRYNTFKSTNNAPILFSYGPTHLPLVAIDSNNRLGLRTNPNVDAMITVAQSDPALPAVMSQDSGDAVKWILTLADNGNKLAFSRKPEGCSPPANCLRSNFVVNSSVGVKGVPAVNTLLTVNGTSGGTSAWQNYSDRFQKTNLMKIENSLQILNELRPVSYKLKNSVDQQVHFGFIAQEIQKIIPEIVTQNGSYLGLKLDQLVALLIEATKVLESDITQENYNLDQFVLRFCKRHPDEKICQP